MSDDRDVLGLGFVRERLRCMCSMASKKEADGCQG